MMEAFNIKAQVNNSQMLQDEVVQLPMSISENLQIGLSN